MSRYCGLSLLLPFSGSRSGELDNQVEKATTTFEELKSKAGVFCKISDIFGTCPDDVKRARSELDSAEAKGAVAAQRMATIEEAIESMKVQMDCLEKHRRGENCNFWDSLPDAPDTAVLRNKQNAINADLTGFAENCINLLVSLLLKTVAIPLLFIFLLLKIVHINWARI